MAKKCPEEFNPWPPFVDIFASVILVLLLFLLITIVNIGYYAQFKYKISYTASVETKAPIQPEEQTKVTAKSAAADDSKSKRPKENAISFHKIKTPVLSADANNSLFSGGKNQGNAVRYKERRSQSETIRHRLEKKELSLRVSFRNKDIFVSMPLKKKIKLFVGDILRRSKRAVFSVYASDPQNMISSTLAKQIALGRVLHIKNILKSSQVPLRNIKLNLQEEIVSNNPYGDVLIKVYIP